MRDGDVGQHAELVIPLAFEHVGFQHNARSVGLKDINFVVPPGTTTALVGPSGSGKTTLSRLALRLLDPQQGRVTIDGMDLREVAAACGVSVPTIRRRLSRAEQRFFAMAGKCESLSPWVRAT